MIDVTHDLARVSHSEFVEDRFGVQFIHERERSRTKHSLRVDRTATVSKLVDAMVPIAQRYSRGIRVGETRVGETRGGETRGGETRGGETRGGETRGARGETKVQTMRETKRETKRGSDGSTPSPRRTLPKAGESNRHQAMSSPVVSTPSVPSTKRPSMASVPSPRGMSPSGSRGREMLRNDSSDNTPTTPTPAVPRRNKLSVEKFHQQALIREDGMEERDARRNRGRDERDQERDQERGRDGRR
jgi:hypothetical protein